MDAPNESLPALAESLSRCASLIDRTFTRVGDQLGDGLTLFEALKSKLDALSAELASGELEAARVSLRRLAAELRAFGAGLPAETATLQAIATRDAEATQSLDLLREHLQLIGILAQSTRIEAASVQSHRDELRVFSNRIVALTADARATVEGCIRNHDRLTGLLATALVRQRDFVAQYCDSLTSVASKLESSTEALDERLAKNLAMTADAAAHSAKISMAVGGAIVAMQSGDSIRQRIEHCVRALGLSTRAAGDAGFAGAGRSSAAHAATDFVLRRLQSAQLREAGLALFDEIRQIDKALTALEDDTRSMVELGRSVHGSDDASSRSFLETLQGELSAASVLMLRCDEARDIVDRATETLANSLAQFQATVSTLSEKIQDIVMIGTNAGLLAVRLGNDGRGLVVISKEVKSVADRIEKDASRLNPIFASIREVCRELRERDRRDADDFATLDRTMRQSLDQMRKSGSNLSATLGLLSRDGAKFGAVVGESRLNFANLAATSEAIEDVADTLDRSLDSHLVARVDAAAVDEVMRRCIWPNYTMAVEREIHGRILDECGVSCDAAARISRRRSTSVRELDDSSDGRPT